MSQTAKLVKTETFKAINAFESLKIMQALRALRARKEAIWECELARREIDGCVDEIIGVCHVHPGPILVGAAGMGFVLGRLKVGTKLMHTGVRIATGPAWQLLRQVIARMT